MRLIQINLNHCEAAQDLLAQTIREKNIDVAILSEPYRNRGGSVWVKDQTGQAALWTCGEQAFQEIMEHPEEGFIRAKVKGIHIYSCYAPPSATLVEYERMLAALVLDARGRWPIIIGGDFNAWALEWGSRITNVRGRVLLEAFAELDVVLANVGSSYTFRGRGLGSIVDLTYVSATLASRIAWHVSEDYTHSDHQAICIEIKGGSSSKKSFRKMPGGMLGWTVKAFEGDTFSAVLKSDISLNGTAGEKATQITRWVTEACDATMPRRRLLPSRQPNYWWNNEIASLRAACFRARRLCQRLRGKPGGDGREEAHKQLRGRLKEAIRRSKKNCFKQLCDHADINPWGEAYRVVMKRLRKSPQVTCPRLLKQIVTTLFPHHENRGRQIFVQLNDGIIPPVTVEELREICGRFGDNKAPGLDGIPNRALKLAVKTRPDLFANTFEACLKEGIFPAQWKKQKLVLLPKPGKQPGNPASYRPICLLDTMGKMMERVIYNRLLPIVEASNGLSERQFGFRRAHSTVDAIGMVVNLAKGALISGGCCAVVALDVKNAFNSANWNRIKGALADIGVPGYLANLVENYLSERTLWYGTDEGPKEYIVTAGVPQGSVLGPLLWNIMYNGVLALPVPEGTTIVGFADDLAVVVAAKHPEDVEVYATETVRAVKSWLEKAGLTLADAKTEAVLITKRRKNNTVKVEVGGHTVVSKPAIKYLGVIIDTKLSFREHLEYACQKAASATTALAKMLPNIGGPKHCRRLVLAGVVRSILLYSSPVWAEALANSQRRKQVNSVYRRMALRVCSAFRTTSDEAVLVVAGMIPVDILAKEMSVLYNARHMEGHAQRRNAARSESLDLWQRRWDESAKGRWTHRLIPNIRVWLERKHGETNYHITQFLTGHGGCYRQYLHRFGLDDFPNCPRCDGIPEDPEHVMFHCPRFAMERRSLNQVLGRSGTPESLVTEMLESEEKWLAVGSAIIEMQQELLKEQRRRKAANRRRMSA